MAARRIFPIPLLEQLHHFGGNRQSVFRIHVEDWNTALLLAFGVGRSIPILLGAWGMGWLVSLTPITRYHRLVEVIGGITLILTGLYFINEYLFIV